MGQLLFKKVFWDAIRDGTKRTTIRRWTAARLKAGQRAFAPGVGWLAIESVEVVEDLSRLNDDDARADGFDSADDLRAALRTIYEGVADDASGAQDGRRWFRVAFRPEPADATPTAKSRSTKSSSRSSPKSRGRPKAATRRTRGPAAGPTLIE